MSERGEELRGREIGLSFEHGVEEPGLVEIVDGFGFVNTGEFYDANTASGEQTDRFAQAFLAVADVGAERQVNGRHMRRLSYANAAAEESEHGVGLGEFHGETYGEENSAVEAEDKSGKKNVSVRTECDE